MTNQEKEIAKQNKLLVIAGNIQLYNALQPKVAKIQAKFLNEVGKVKFGNGEMLAKDWDLLFMSWQDYWKDREVLDKYNRAVNCRFKF